MDDSSNMRVAAFLGSARKGGNTEIFLEAALEGMSRTGVEVRVFRLAELNFRPCENCGGCETTGRCVFRHDGMGELYEAIRSSDRLILASPIYFFSVSAQIKMMIDRCQAFWNGKYLLHQPIPPGPFGRKGLILLVGAYRKSMDGVRCAEVCAASFMRTVNVTEHRCVSVLGPDQAGSIREYPDTMREAAEAGRWLVKT